MVKILGGDWLNARGRLVKSYRNICGSRGVKSGEGTGCGIGGRQGKKGRVSNFELVRTYA